MHEFVVAWERIEDVLIKCILDVPRTAFPVWLVKMTSYVFTEIQGTNAFTKSKKITLVCLLYNLLRPCHTVQFFMQLATQFYTY